MSVIDSICVDPKELKETTLLGVHRDVVVPIFSKKISQLGHFKFSVEDQVHSSCELWFLGNRIEFCSVVSWLKAVKLAWALETHDHLVDPLGGEGAVKLRWHIFQGLLCLLLFFQELFKELFVLFVQFYLFRGVPLHLQDFPDL